MFISNEMRILSGRVFTDSTYSYGKFILATNLLVQASVVVCNSVRMHVTHILKN